MSSVIDEKKCEHCGGVATTEFDCRTFEEYVFCHRCGMIDNHVIVRDENGDAVLDEDGKMPETRYLSFARMKLRMGLWGFWQEI